MKPWLLILFASCSRVLTTGISEGNSVEGDIQDIMEMVPFERVMGLSMEYAISDPQVKQFLHYLSSDPFSSNVAEFEASPQFHAVVQFAERYNIDLYSVANRVNGFLDLPHLQRNRTKRSPGEGVMSLVKDVLEMAPLSDMHQVYHYKIDTNPEFKELVEQLMTADTQRFLMMVTQSKPLQDTKADLVHMGIPIDDIVKCMTERLTVVFKDDHQQAPVQY